MVLRGQRLDERRDRVADAIRRADIAEEALHVYTTRPRVTVPPEMRRLFDWVAAEPLVRESTVLRAAMYFWGMGKHFGQWNSVSTVLMHEFCVGRVDPYGLLSLSCATEAQRNMQGSAFDGQAMDSTGDFTTIFETFVSALDLVLRERVEQLGRITDNAAYLPWQVVAPPDELEARMFDVVQRLGTAGSTGIVAALGSDVPPMRTVKNGARKMATYSVPGRDVA